MLTCAGADRLQTGMRGAYGKPEGFCARVAINQILFSVRTKDMFRKQILEAFRRATYKFPGRQHIIVSQMFGFSSLERSVYEKMDAEGKFAVKGTHSQKIKAHGKLDVKKSMTPDWEALKHTTN
jgi:large subunit ribosomal protein L10e